MSIFFGDENIARMQKGLAPQRINPNTGKIESMELHKNPAHRNGGQLDLIEAWPDEYAVIDPNRSIGG